MPPDNIYNKKITMEKYNPANSLFNFKPVVCGRIASRARKHKLSNEVRLVYEVLEWSL